MARYGIQSSSAFHSQATWEVTVSYLPLSHITAQMYDLWTGMYWGMKICFAEPNALKVSLRSARAGAASGSRAAARARVCSGPCRRSWGVPVSEPFLLRPAQP